MKITNYRIYLLIVFLGLFFGYLSFVRYQTFAEINELKTSDRLAFDKVSFDVYPFYTTARVKDLRLVNPKINKTISDSSSINYAEVNHNPGWSNTKLRLVVRFKDKITDEMVVDAMNKMLCVAQQKKLTIDKFRLIRKKHFLNPFSVPIYRLVAVLK
jgi:hypothetical protein